MTRTPPCLLREPPVGRRIVTCPGEEGHDMENNGAASPGRLPGGGGLLPGELGAAPTRRRSVVVTRPGSACPTTEEPDEAPERGAGTLQPLHDPDAGAEPAGRGPARAAPGRAAAPAREGAGGEDARRAGLAGASAKVSACAPRRPRPAPTRCPHSVPPLDAPRVKCCYLRSWAFGESLMRPKGEYSGVETSPRPTSARPSLPIFQAVLAGLVQGDTHVAI